MKIKLYVASNCPVCEQVKCALKCSGDTPTIKSIEIDREELIEDLVARDIDIKQIKAAPVMIIEECSLAWTGHDCLIAIEEKEWEYKQANAPESV